MNSIKMKIVALPDLIENFSLFDDWEGRYQYLIDLGGKLPPMEAALKNEQTEVKGCVSKVWLYYRKDEDGIFHFVADSDGNITRGLVYIVLSAYDGLKADQISGIDIDDIFTNLGLEGNLSPNRRNGFFAMVGKIKSLASA